MTTRVEHLTPVCEWASCAETVDLRITDGFHLCPPHAREHSVILRTDLRSKAVREGWHPQQPCQEHGMELIRRHEQVITLLRRQRDELDRLLESLTTPPKTARAARGTAAEEILSTAHPDFTLDELLLTRDHLSSRGVPAPAPADLTLFDMPDADPVEKLSAGQRLTTRQHAAVAAGFHPLTKTRARPDLGTCGTCALRVLFSYPKCTLGGDVEARRAGPYMTRGPATDCRAWWPACDQHVAKEPV